MEDKLKDLMIEALEGSKMHYKQLLNELEKLASGYVRKKLGESAYKDDVCQEILISVHKAKHTYNAEKKFLPWFYAISYYRVQDYLRKYYAVEDLNINDDNFLDNFSHDSSDGEKIENSDFIEKSVAILPKKQKMIINYMYVDGFTAREISEKMNITISDVKVSGHRALKLLKDKFGGER